MPKRPYVSQRHIALAIRKAFELGWDDTLSVDRKRAIRDEVGHTLNLPRQVTWRALPIDGDYGKRAKTADANPDKILALAAQKGWDPAKSTTRFARVRDELARELGLPPSAVTNVMRARKQAWASEEASRSKEERKRERERRRAEAKLLADEARRARAGEKRKKRKELIRTAGSQPVVTYSLTRAERGLVASADFSGLRFNEFAKKAVLTALQADMNLVAPQKIPHGSERMYVQLSFPLETYLRVKRHTETLGMSPGDFAKAAILEAAKRSQP